MPAPTLDEIKSRVPADIRASRNTFSITQALNVGRTKIVESRIRERHVLDTLGAEEGAAVLDAIRSAAPPDGSTPARRKARPMWYALRAMEPNAEGLDVGNPKTREQLDGMVLQGIMTQAQADKLKSIAVVPDPASEFEVRQLVWSVDGAWLAD